MSSLGEQLHASVAGLDVHTSDLTDPCPQHVDLRLRGKIVGATTTALYRGNLFHEAVANLYRRNKWDRPACESAIMDGAVAEDTKAKLEHRPMSESVVTNLPQHKAEVLALVVAYAQRFHPAGDDRIIGVELPIRWTMEHPSLDEPVNFASHLDLLWRRGADGHLCVRDWKLREDPPSPAFLARNLQMVLYWLMVRYGKVLIDDEEDAWVEFGEFPLVEWFHATDLAPYAKATGEAKRGDPRPTGRIVHYAPLSPDAEDIARDVLAQRVAMYRAGFYPAMPDPVGCRICDGRGACPSFTGGNDYDG